MSKNSIIKSIIDHNIYLNFEKVKDMELSSIIEYIEEEILIVGEDGICGVSVGHNGFELNLLFIHKNGKPAKYQDQMIFLDSDKNFMGSSKEDGNHDEYLSKSIKSLFDNFSDEIKERVSSKYFGII